MDWDDGLHDGGDNSLDDAYMQEVNETTEAFEAYMAEHEAKVSHAAQHRDHQMEVAALQAEKENMAGERLANMVKELQGQKVDQQAEMLNRVLDGVVEQFKQAQQHTHEQLMQHKEHLIRLEELAQAERELVRDEKTGKAKGSRVKKAA